MKVKSSKLTKSTILPFTFLIISSTLIFAQPDTWQQKAGGYGNITQFSFAINGKGYFGLSQFSAEVWEYDAALDVWTQKADFPGALRNGTASFATTSKGYVGTGTTSDFFGTWLNDFWEFDPVANSWTARATFPGGVRYNGTGFSIGAKGYIGMGYNGSYLNDLWEYDPASDTWTAKANLPSAGREGPFSFSAAGMGYVGTGKTGFFGPWTNDFWQYNPGTDSWVRKADFTTLPRWGATGGAIGNRGFAGGGYDNVGFVFLNDFWEYDPASDTWIQRANLGGGVRSGGQTFSIGGKLFLGMGGNPSQLFDLWEYTPAVSFNNSSFVTQWDLSIPGSSPTEISLGTATSGTVNYTWQELSPGTATGSGSWSGTNLTITGLPAGATIRLQIAPSNFQRIIINYDVDRDRLTHVENWGSVNWTSMLYAFEGCTNLQVTATDIPNLSNVLSLSNMFAACANLSGPSNINLWNTGTITNMQGVFKGATNFNQNINSWNTSSVTIMESMFGGAHAFDQDISSWDVGNVTDMTLMFANALQFNQDISGWSVGNVTNMSGMFLGTQNFNQNINSWDVSNVTNMSSMFMGSNFNQSIDSWDVSNVIDMSSMFSGTGFFNRDISAWNVSNVTNMSRMFKDAFAFNQPIGSWDVSSVTNMSDMFGNSIIPTNPFNQNIGSWNTAAVTDMARMFNLATSFNQDISSWNTAAVTNMNAMFFNASAFNQNIGSWVLNPGVSMTNMFSASGVNCNNYSATLIGWSTNPSTPNGRTLGATGRQYGTNAAAGRTNLTTTKGWTIVGDSPSGTLCAVVSVPTITSFTPISGPIGTTVVVAGTNFDPVAASNTVRFNGVTATTPSAASATSLTVTVPVGATTGPIFVTTLAGTGSSNTNFTVTCTPPTPPTSLSVSRCETGTVTLTASGATGTQEYRWYDVSTGGTSIASTASFTTPSLSVTTPFYVSILEVATSCESARTLVNAIVNTPPAAPAPINNSGCSGTSIVLGASGGSPGLYRWYTVPTAGTADGTQQNNAFTTPLLTTTTSYWVAITDGTCESPRTEVVATVLPVPNTPGITPVDPVCPGSTTNVVASGTTNGNYRWYEGGTLLPGEVNALLTVSNIISNRTVSVAIAIGPCESSRASIMISLKNCTPPVIAPSTTTAFIEGTITINLCDLISDAENDLDASSIQAVGTLTSGAPFSLDGCTLTVNYAGVPFPGTDRLTVRACDQTGLCTEQEVSIELGGEITVYNAFSPNGDGKNDRFYIQYIDVLPEAQQNRVTIYNRWGDAVWSAANYDNTTVAFTGRSDNDQELPSGTYYYMIEFANGGKRRGFISLKK